MIVRLLLSFATSWCLKRFSESLSCIQFETDDVVNKAGTFTVR